MIQPNDASLEAMKKRFVELIGDSAGVFFEDKFYVRLPIAEEAAIALATEWAAKEKWVSVEDMLPEISEDPIYLVFHRPRFPGDYHTTQCGFTSIDAGIWPYVIKWQPIPQPPTNQQK